VQGHGDDEVGAGVDFGGELFGQEVGQVQALAVFIVLQQGVEWVGVAVDGAGDIERRRVFEAAAADFAQGGGQGADRAAGRGQARQVGQAAGAERGGLEIRAGDVGAAELAGLAGLADAGLRKRYALVQCATDNN
jgi:hypothetical protein